MAKNIVKKGNIVYLRVRDEWYCFDITHAPLGAGAMGTVFLGWNANNPGEKVAIKQVTPQHQDLPQIRKRAFQEGNLLFRHPNLVEMVGCCSEYPDRGPLFILSHIVYGINMDVHVRQNLRKVPDSVNRICRAFFPVLDALQFLHEHEILHLDVKPSNIMLEGGRQARLMDLGIAGVDQMGIDIGDSRIGTMQYAAPEQAGGVGVLNPSTDVYAAAVTLFELLTDANPFDAPTQEGMILNHRTVSLPYVKEVPNRIIDVLRKATDVDQKQRYQTAIELKSALVQALNKPKFPWMKAIVIGLSVIVAILILLILII